MYVLKYIHSHLHQTHMETWGQFAGVTSLMWDPRDGNEAQIVRFAVGTFTH